ncbi:MAG: hypothetical protein QOK17_108 [Sphingomonadales bacterium]|jgi:hypothetical protein|nr:hypothetical protein [Sphingomonadales bacterium]
MKISLPRNLFPQIHEDSAVNPTSRRKVVLPRITRQILEHEGYTFGDKIRVPGGYAYEVTAPDGEALRIGLKTAVNRWLNTATTLVEKVDRVIIATFEWDEDDEKPVAFELVEISSSALLGMIGKVRKAAKAEGWDPYGHYYMPLDEKRADDGPFDGVAGAVIPAGRILFGPEKVTWVKDEWGEVVAAASPNEDATGHSGLKAADVGAIVAKAKADLAGRLGVPLENIDLSIRF